MYYYFLWSVKIVGSAVGSIMWFKLCEGVIELDVQDSPLTQLAVGGSWLEAYLGLLTSELAHGLSMGFGLLTAW